MINRTSTDNNYIVVVTGGSGFLGTAMLEELLDQSPALQAREIRVIDLEPLRIEPDDRVKYIRGDVRNLDLLKEAFRNADLVIHSAAVVDWGTKSEKEIMSVNFDGTRNVIEACRGAGVQALVCTSSLDVLFDGRPLRNVDEATPYPERHSTSYCVSKYLAEKKVIEADGDGLKTCVLRPADIYGERDPYHIGNLIDMAKGGFYVRLGNGRAACQHVYVRNAAHAHLLAGSELLDGAGIRGQVYFLTDGPGTNFFTFFDKFVEGAGYRIWPKRLWLPRWLAYGLGAISELTAVLLRPVKDYRPGLSRFAVTYTCTDYTFSSDKAAKDFGFTPKYSPEEAFRNTIEHFKKGTDAR